MQRTLPLIGLVLLLGLVVGYYIGYDVGFERTPLPQPPQVIVDSATNFIECVEAGNPVMESFPRQCRTAGGKLFIEEIGNALEKADLIRLTTPQPNETLESPLVITGEARGYWFFEATFPIVLTNWDGLIIAEGYATADGEWMTEEFVPFTAELSFARPDYGNTGALILQKANASGLPEHDDALEIPIRY